MSYLLKAFGYEVTCETNGASGLKTAISGAYGLVLSDILMPDMDGFEFARRFKADQRVARTPLVAVTALAMAGDREKILAAGFDGYISKPIDPRTFGSQIAAFLVPSG
jgi:two-component system cell cycle response regulator